MKTTHSRRYRRVQRSLKSNGSFFKKDSQQEQSFFGDSPEHGFFNPAVINKSSQSVQRKCKDCEEEENKVQRQPVKKEEEEKVQRQPMPEKEEEDIIQREPEKEEEKKVQMKENNSSPIAGKGTASFAGTLGSKGNNLPNNTNYFFSSRMGFDFSGVKVHTGREASDSAKQINARAYTIGNNIVFNEGEYNTESSEGKKLLAHELVHVIQQSNQAADINKKIDRKIMYSVPSYKKEDPIPKILTGAGGKLGETYITINGKKLLTKLDAIKAVYEAFNKNLTLNYDAGTKKCKVNTKDININISAEITILTDPVSDKWGGQYPGSIVTGSYVCSKLPSVNIKMVVKPSGGAALHKSVNKDEAQHFTDIIELSEKHIEAFHTYLENISLASDTGADCAAKFNAEVGTKDIDMAKAFTDDWLKAVNKHDDPATGTHHYKSVTDARNCNLVKIKVNF